MSLLCRLAGILAIVPLLAQILSPAFAASEPSARWWKGNLHTHSLWSDGDDFPEMIADWYKRNGYHFVSLTDHNTVATEERWWPVPDSGILREAYDKYRKRFGASVEQRRVADTLSVRLRRPSEYAPQLDEPGKFLLVGGEVRIWKFVPRYNFSAARYNTVDVTEVMHVPGIEFKMNDYIQILAEYAYWTQKSPTGTKRFDNTLAMPVHGYF